MAHQHDPKIRETIEIAVEHCSCGAWKRRGGEWMPGPFGPVEQIVKAILTAPPEVRGVVRRLLDGDAAGNVGTVRDALLDTAAAMERRTRDCDDGSGALHAATLRRLAGE